MKKLTVVLVAAIAAPALAQPIDDAREKGRELTGAFSDGDLGPLIEAFIPEFVEGIGGEEGLREIRDPLVGELGTERRVYSESVDERPGGFLYRRTARFEGYGGPVVVFWAFDAGGNIYGLRVETLAPTEEVDSRYLDHETKADLRLPVGGEWCRRWATSSSPQERARGGARRTAETCSPLVRPPQPWAARAALSPYRSATPMFVASALPCQAMS